MLVGLLTIGSEANNDASSPSAGLSIFVDFSAVTWASVATGQARAATPRSAPRATPRRNGWRRDIDGLLEGERTSTGPSGAWAEPTRA